MTSMPSLRLCWVSIFHEIAHIIYCDFAEEQKAIVKSRLESSTGELPDAEDSGRG